MYLNKMEMEEKNTLYFQRSMTYVFYGSLAILMWKCGTQLMSEIVYKPLHEEEDLMTKTKLRKNHPGMMKK